MPEPIRWRLHPLARLHWRRWADDWVVYDEASGIAHRLDTLRATTLLLVEEGPADLNHLAREVDAELQTGEPTALPGLLGTLLAEFEGSRLVCRAAP